MIKKFFQKINNSKKSIMIKSFIMNSALATIIVIILVMLIFFWFQNKSLEDINSVTRLMLSNMDYKATQLFNGSGELAYQIFKNNNTIELMMSEERNITNEVRISTNLENVMISNPYIQSIYICNHKKVLMRKDRESYYDAESDKQIFDVIYKSNILTPIERCIPVGNNQNLNLFTIIYHTAYPNNDQLDGAVVLNINANTLYKFISSQSVPEDSSTFVIGLNGQVLAHQDNNMFLKNISNEKYIKTILKEQTKSGVYYININKEKFAASFVRSENLKMIFISLNPYRTITGKLNQAKDFILIICLLLLLILIVSYFILALRLFKPVTQIINSIKANSTKLGFTGENTRDEFRYISQTFSGVLDYINILDKRDKDNIYLLRNNFIWSLLNERDEILPIVELEKEFKNYKIEFNMNQPYVVIVIRMDNYKSLCHNNSAKSKNLLLFSVGNIACELLEEDYSCNAFETDSDHEILLVNIAPSKVQGFEEKILSTLKKIQENIEKFLQISVTIAVSDISEETSQIRSLFNQAILFTNYRLTHGTGCLFTRNMLPQPGYPACEKEIKDVILSVKEGDKLKFIICFEILLKKTKFYNYERSVKLFTDLYVELMKVLGNLNLKVNQNDEIDMIRVFKDINDMENPKELQDYFINAFESVSGQVVSANHLVSRDLIKDAIDYIEQNYQDSQISGANVAKHLSMSPQYFSKIFTDYTGCSFPEYLNKVRLEKSRQLLLTSDKNAFEIGEIVGYINRSYFSTLFKKEYGVSPSKYRLLNTKN